jgi:hypothetical protein
VRPEDVEPEDFAAEVIRWYGIEGATRVRDALTRALLAAAP